MLPKVSIQWIGDGPLPTERESVLELVDRTLIQYTQLVGGLEPWNLMTFHMLGISSSQLTNSYFSEG